MYLGRFIIYVISLAFSTIAYGQDSTFAIEFPKGWVQFQRNDVINSLKNNFDLSDKKKEEILASSNSSQLFGYAAPSKPGALYRPNIQVLLIKNQTQNFSQFSSLIGNSLESFKTKISDFKILDSPSVMIIDGKQSVYSKISGYLPTKTGGKAQMISRIYAIPIGRYFYQITMNDSEDYNCEEEFKQVFMSLKL